MQTVCFHFMRGPNCWTETYRCGGDDAETMKAYFLRLAKDRAREVEAATCIEATPFDFVFLFSHALAVRVHEYRVSTGKETA